MLTNTKEPQHYVPVVPKTIAKREIEQTVAEDGYSKDVALNGITVQSQEGVVDLGMSSYNELIIGTQTAATNLMTGVSRLPSASYFVNGYRFTYWNPWAGTSTAATLTLTFQDNSTKTVNLYYKGTTRMTTHMGAGSKIDFVYLENAEISGSTYTGCWPDADYNSDTTNAYSVRSYYERNRLYSNTAPLYRYKICGYHDGYIVPIVITNQTSAAQVNKAPTTIGLDVCRGLTYYNTTTTVSTNKAAIGNYLQENIYSSAGSYNFNETIPVYCDIFLVGKSFDGQYLTLDNTQTGTAYKSYYCFAEKGDSNTHALTADYFANFIAGKYYWFVGSSYSTADYYQLKINHPLFYYDGTSLIPIALGISECTNGILLPTSAPVNPQIGKAYMYYDETNHQLCVIESDGTLYKTTLTT